MRSVQLSQNDKIIDLHRPNIEHKIAKISILKVVFTKIAIIATTPTIQNFFLTIGKMDYRRKLGREFKFAIKNSNKKGI